MVATERWKYVHAPGYAPVLFDLESDPAAPATGAHRLTAQAENATRSATLRFLSRFSKVWM